MHSMDGLRFVETRTDEHGLRSLLGLASDRSAAKMSFLLKWLGLASEATNEISVRPARAFSVSLEYEAAFYHCVRGLEDVLGARVRELDAGRGTIDASFGLMFSERIACLLRPAEVGTTHVIIESRRIAGAQLPKGTPVLDRLELWMREGR